MNIEVLLSTMNSDEEMIRNINLSTKCTVINQCDEENEVIKYIDENCVKVISKIERGLSRSRNLAIIHSTEEVVLLADDDLRYDPKYPEIIVEAYHSNPQYDIIVFQVEGINGKFKDYSPKEKELGFLTSMRVSSVEISFRKDSVLNAGIKFNELLGAGAKYSMGEENCFLYDCLRAGLKIKYIPIKIADLYIGNSSWFNGFNSKYFVDRGAVFTAMSPKLSWILIVQFAIRHYRKYRNEMSFIKGIQYMLQGNRAYKRDIKETAV